MNVAINLYLILSTSQGHVKSASYLVGREKGSALLKEDNIFLLIKEPLLVVKNRSESQL